MSTTRRALEILRLLLLLVLTYFVQVRNDQTWLLCGYLCDRAKMSVWDALVIAKRHLLEHVVVGVMEDMPSFKASFMHYFPGWWEERPESAELAPSARSLDDGGGSVRVVNGHIGRHTALTPEDEAMLRSLLKPDIELYRLASIIRMEQNRCATLSPSDPEAVQKSYIYL